MAKARTEVLGRWLPLVELQLDVLLGAAAPAECEPATVAQEALRQVIAGESEEALQDPVRCCVRLRRVALKILKERLERLGADPSLVQRARELSERLRQDEQAQPLHELEAILAVAEALRQLDENARRLVVDRTLRREPLEEIARKRQMPLPEVQKQWLAAIARLKAILAGAPSSD